MSVKFKYMNIKIKDRVKNQNKIEINFDEDQMERFLFFKKPNTQPLKKINKI